MFSFFATLAAAIPSRVLLALGIGFVSMAGFGALIEAAASQVQSYWGGLGGSILQIASLGGFPLGIGIVLGAAVARAALTGLEKLGKVV